MNEFPFSSPVEVSKTSAEKYITYLRTLENFPQSSVPEVVIIAYQKSTLASLLQSRNHEPGSSFLSKLFFFENSKVAVLGGFGIGAPALTIKIEELIAWGVKKFISVGTAGSLSEEVCIGDWTIGTKALCREDGVSHLYVEEGEVFAYPETSLCQKWMEFCSNKEVFLKPVGAWSFCNPYRETHGDIARVKALGCDVVEMEAATLYAIGKEKNVECLALFVISDSLHGEHWEPRFKDPSIKENLESLSRYVLEFSEQL